MSKPLLIGLSLLAACTKGGDTDPDNAPPGAPTVTVGPQDADTLDDLVATIDVDSADGDGDAVTYTWTWTRDGASMPDLTGDTVPADETTRGEVWSVTVTPNDGTANGEVGTAQITIGNAPPSMVVDLDPDNVGTNGRLVAEGKVTDPDDDGIALSYDWTVNGVAVSATGHALDGDFFFDRGDTVEVTVTADDGEGGIVTGSKSVIIGNTAPDAPIVAITPNPALDLAPLTCVVDTPASNADGDTAIYTATWTVNGTAFTDTNRTNFEGDTVPATATMVGDVWVCTVTPTDGRDDGDVGTASATITAWKGDLSFDPCGAIGQDGPSQEMCDLAYVGSPLSGEVLVTGGVQTWVSPLDGTLVIEACGAAGASAGPDLVGGAGACVTAMLTLTRGDELLVAVGQVGSGAGAGSNGGGGGGTFVIASDDTPLLIAAGGGGTRVDSLIDGCPGSATEYAGTGSGGIEEHDCSLKTDGLGEGGIVSSPSWGSAGAGFRSDGESDGEDADGDGVKDSLWGTGGKSWSNGLHGGDDAGSTTSLGCGANALGGFGGGGAGNGCYGGGGGGGYSGGDGGHVAGGGGSYNIDTTTGSGVDGANGGDGYVRIRLASE